MTSRLKAHLLLKKNVDALLQARGQHRKQLAQWCYKSESWISKIFSDPDRNIPLKYLDRMADFFGLATYQLFQPGIAPLTERRSGADRRRGSERRRIALAEIVEPAPTMAELEALMRRLEPEEYRRFARRAFGEIAAIDSLRGGRGPRDLPPADAPPHEPAQHNPPKRRRRG